MDLFVLICWVILALMFFVQGIVDIKYQYRYKVNKLLRLNRKLKPFSDKLYVLDCLSTSKSDTKLLKKYLKLMSDKRNLIEELETILEYKEIIK